MIRIAWRKSRESAAAVALGLSLVAVALAIVSPHWTATAQGEIRETPRPEAFLSGGARSEQVLREMLEVLKRIDGRLERFEQALQADAPAQASPAPQP